MEEKKIYILNPDYTLRKDQNRVILTNRIADPTIKDFIGFVHPLYAIILSFFDGEKNLGQVLKATSELLRKDQGFISNIITPLLENKEGVHFHYDNYHFSFPEKLLVNKNSDTIPKKYNLENFFIPRLEMALESRRMNFPLDIFFMINTRCVTNCVYCYADRSKRMDCEISLERLKELIREAKALDMRSFDITGGELFLYKHWEKFLAELLDNAFNPYISTKCPLEPKTIKRLKELGIKRIQVSIDSIIKDELMNLLNVNEDYCDRLLATLNNLDENGFEIYTNTQLTSINTNHVDTLIEGLLNFKNIKRINIGAAGFSLYKGENDFHKYKAVLSDIKRIESYVHEMKEKYRGSVSINFSGYVERAKILNTDKEEKKKNFQERSSCSGNFYSLFILPDGKVTICEELYWHPAFIIGDLTKQSIMETWNSKRALELYNISRDMVKEESQCKTCNEFDQCHKYKGVCWKEILYAYGYENWDFPDPKCHCAPEPSREYYY
ncbi:MAG TPA: radical SAM protein [Candidatus Kapabacteria bacterium]|nr:radical SAM protein [Candidatus Kapabacteria bacterium]